jgi:DNA repair protein RadC
MKKEQLLKDEQIRLLGMKVCGTEELLALFIDTVLKNKETDTCSVKEILDELGRSQQGVY